VEIIPNLVHLKRKQGKIDNIGGQINTFCLRAVSLMKDDGDVGVACDV
jgi:hypothetical protein